MLPLQFLLIHQHNIGAAVAFQPHHPQIGYAGGRLRPWRINHGQKLLLSQRLELHPSPFYAKSSYNRRVGVSLSATENENSDTPLDEILEKFALPLEFKKIASASSSSSSNNDDAASTKDVNDSSSQTESSSSKAEIPTPKAETESSPAPEKSNSIGSFTPSADTPLANKYYQKKMQLAEEGKKALEIPCPTLPMSAITCLASSAIIARVLARRAMLLMLCLLGATGN